MVCQRVQCSTKVSSTGWVKDNGESSQRTYTVRGQALERLSQVSTMLFWVDENTDVDGGDEGDGGSGGSVNSRKSRDHNLGLAMAAERHREQILEMRRGMRMV